MSIQNIEEIKLNLNDLIKKYKSITESISNDIWQGSSKDNAIDKFEEFAKLFSSTLIKQLTLMTEASKKYEQIESKKVEHKTLLNKKQMSEATQDIEKASLYNTQANEIDSEINKLKLELKETVTEVLAIDKKLNYSTVVLETVNTNAIVQESTNINDNTSDTTGSNAMVKSTSKTIENAKYPKDFPTVVYMGNADTSGNVEKTYAAIAASAAAGEATGVATGTVNTGASTTQNSNAGVSTSMTAKENSSKGFNLTTNNKKYQLSEGDYNFVCSVIASEAHHDYDDALAVASVVLNRADDGKISPSEVLKRKGQFSGYFDGYYKKYYNGSKAIPSCVKSAVNDALNGIRNNGYFSFRSNGSTGYSSNMISTGGNRYK